MRLMLMVAVAVFTFYTNGAAAQPDITQSIVKIYTTYDPYNYLRPWQMQGQRNRIGSGCIIDQNRILTNAHVVSDHTFIRVRRAGRAEKYVATVEAVSHELDLALLNVADDEFFKDVRPLQLGELPRVGDTVSALGFPRGGTRITVTEGIVSRIERNIYSHSRYKNLVCQIDAAINPGSSGGPVISNGQIVGVMFQSTSGQNIGYMVPSPVIRHFFEDLQDGRHDGVPTLFFVWQNLENPQMRSYYGMTRDQSGILIKAVSPPFEGEQRLMSRDVLLALDGHDVANDGTIRFRQSERISFNHAVDRKQLNSSVRVDVLRDGKVLTQKIALDVPRSQCGYLIPRIQYETAPTYFIIGGLVFSPLTSNLLNTWPQWGSIPTRLKKYYMEIITAKNQQRRDVIVLMDILPDKINVGYDAFEDWVVSSVNGQAVNSMAQLVGAFENQSGSYHRILFEDHDAEIIFKTADLDVTSRSILQNYRIDADRSIDLR